MKVRKVPMIVAPFLCAMSAPAAERIAVAIPFSFESHGKLFPASQYEVELSDDRRHMVMSSVYEPLNRIPLLAYPAGLGPNDPELSVRFESGGDIHELRSVRLGAYTALLSKPRAGSR
jgi:hypothetical protein